MVDIEGIVEDMILGGDCTLDFEKLDKLFPILKSYDRTLKRAKGGVIAGHAIFSTVGIGLLAGGIAMFVKGDLVPATALFLSSTAANLAGKYVMDAVKSLKQKSLLKKGYKQYLTMAEVMGQEIVSKEDYEQAIKDYQNLTYSDLLTSNGPFKIGNIGKLSPFEAMYMHRHIDFADEMGDVDKIMQRIEDIDAQNGMYEIYGEDFLKPEMIEGEAEVLNEEDSQSEENEEALSERRSV